MVHHGKSNTLINIHGLAKAIDAHYWEYQAKITCETRNSALEEANLTQSLILLILTLNLAITHHSPRTTLALCRAK